MNFDFSEDLKLLREQARAFLREKCPLSAPRKILEGQDQYDRSLWKAMAEMGWLGAAIPEEFGGAEMGQLAVCVLAEELGRALAPVPFASSVCLATEALLIAGSRAQKERFLPLMSRGDAIGTWAAAERVGTVDLARLTTTFQDGRVNGVKNAVPDGEIADFAIVVANEKGGNPVMLVVDLGASGIRREPVPSIDPTRPLARIHFENVAAERMGDPVERGRLSEIMNRAAILMAFEQVGGAQAALDDACSYANGRFAFGRPIGSFQGVKHKLADIYVAIELARSLAYFGAWALSTGDAQLSVAASAARAAASEAFWVAARENLHVHGGMGMTWDGDCQFYFRRSKYLGSLLGSALEWKEILVKSLSSAPVEKLAG